MWASKGNFTDLPAGVQKISQKKSLVTKGGKYITCFPPFTLISTIEYVIGWENCYAWYVLFKLLPNSVPA